MTSSAADPTRRNRAALPGTATPSFEIWCRVVDNFGDAAVCWRLARQLAREHRAAVLLRIDEPAALARLVDNGEAVFEATGDTMGVATSDARSATLHGVRLRRWSDLPDGEPDADVAIAAFSCTLPPWRRARLTPPSGTLWIDLEYLSAESWVDTSHGLPSIKPADGAREWFFFPGFGERTGGLLRERDLIAQRERFRGGCGPSAWLSARGIERDDALVVSLFCYPYAPLEDLVTVLVESARRTRLLVPEGVATDALARALGRLPTADRPVTRGALTVHRLSWMSQDEYDRLLWSCDLNLVRGEDSWVRAHWAGQPFAWSPYRQDDGAHLAKLDAWLDRLLSGQPPRIAEPVRAFGHAWSGDGSIAASWPAFAATLAPADDTTPWARLSALQAGTSDLATRLLEFVRSRSD